jgi:thioredoxin reductase
MVNNRNPQHSTQFDVAVIGGGAAGLTAAVTLGRARRSVVVIDSGEPRNASADGVHMFLTRDGIPPSEFGELGRREVAQYGGSLISAAAVVGNRVGGGFEITLDSGAVVAARRLLVTTGLIDELPDVPGVRELWGRDVHHCPYCHGWELRGQAVGVLGTGPRAVHQALMFRQWVEDLVLFVHTAPEPTSDEQEQLAARGIQVISGRVDSLDIDNGHLREVRLADGPAVARQSLVVAPRFVARSRVLLSLGLTAKEHPMGLGEFIPADPTGLTEVPGVWVAGNVTDLSAGVVVAAAGGMTAAAAINADLIADDTRNAVAAYRESAVPKRVGARA